MIRNATIIMPITSGMTIFISEFDPFPIPDPPDLRKKLPLPPPGNPPPPPASSRGSPSGVVLLFLPLEKTHVRHLYVQSSFNYPLQILITKVHV